MLKQRFLKKDSLQMAGIALLLLIAVLLLLVSNAGSNQANATAAWNATFGE